MMPSLEAMMLEQCRQTAAYSQACSLSKRNIDEV